MRYRKIPTMWSIRRILALLIVAIFLPGAGIIVQTGIQDRRRELEDAKRDAMLLVEGLSAQQEKIALGTRQLLSTLALLPQVQDLDAEACNKLFRELRDQNPMYSAMGASTPDGTMFANARDFEPGSVNISEQKHIRDTIESLGFSAGEYMVGRLSNVPAIYYGYPVLDVNKRLVAIVTAGVRLTEYDSFIKKANLPADSALVILDHRGVRLYRFPENDAAPLGVAPTAGIKPMADLQEGTYERKSDDGIYRLFAFKHLHLSEDSSPYLFISVGIPKDKILQKANIAMLYKLLFLGTAALVAVSLAWIFGSFALIKPINRLVATTQRFGGGEMDVRTGLPHTPDELGKLAQSIDDMADLLEQRNRERKKAEEELISAYRQNQLILNTAGEGIVGLDDKGTIIFVNLAARETLGYEEQELIGKDVHLTIHHSFADGTHYPETDCPMWQCLRNGTSCRVRNEVLWRKDGTSFPTAYSSTPIVENGQVVGVVITFRDISVRRRAEEELRRANQYLENVLESSPEGIGIVDESGRFIKWNRMAEELYGYRFEEMRGIKAFDLYADQGELEKMLTQLRREGSVRKWEMMMRRKDSSVVPFEISIGLLRDSENRTIGSVTVARDLSDTKKTIDALKASNDQLNREITERERAENIMHARLRLLEFAESHSLDEFLTATLDEIEALTGSTIGFYHFLESDQRMLSLQNWSTNTLKTMCTAVGKGSHYAVDQAGVWVECVYERHPVIHNDYASLPHRKGMPEGHAPVIRELVVPIFRGNLIKAIIGAGNKSTDYSDSDIQTISQIGDLSWDMIERKLMEEERERLEAQLRQAQKLDAIGTLAGGIAHDFNNILAAILGFSEMALDDIPESSTAHHDVRQVLKASHRAKDLVQQILAFSRRGDSQERKPILLHPIIKEALKLLRATLPTTIELHQKIAADAGVVIADPSQIHQVVVNLCTNAGHAMRDHGGLLEVTLAKVDLDADGAAQVPG
jgi:PAS domain S-box-containing protein